MISNLFSIGVLTLDKQVAQNCNTYDLLNHPVLSNKRILGCEIIAEYSESINTKWYSLIIALTFSSSSLKRSTSVESLNQYTYDRIRHGTASSTRHFVIN